MGRGPVISPLSLTSETTDDTIGETPKDTKVGLSDVGGFVFPSEEGSSNLFSRLERRRWNVLRPGRERGRQCQFDWF